MVFGHLIMISFWKRPSIISRTFSAITSNMTKPITLMMSLTPLLMMLIETPY